MDPTLAHKGPYRALMGPKVAVEQTLIADSTKPNLMTKTKGKVPYGIMHKNKTSHYRTRYTIPPHHIIKHNIR
jgi:hypothetical protein